MIRINFKINKKSKVKQKIPYSTDLIILKILTKLNKNPCNIN